MKPAEVKEEGKAAEEVKAEVVEEKADVKEEVKPEATAPTTTEDAA